MINPIAKPFPANDNRQSLKQPQNTQDKPQEDFADILAQAFDRAYAGKIIRKDGI